MCEYVNCDYSEDLDETSGTGIGNITRRMLEVLSSFCYSEPFETMTRSEGVISNVSEDKRVYYESFTCRLILNGENHEERRAYALSNFTLFFTREKKLQAAESVLLSLLYVNEPHVKAYPKPEVVARMKSWKREEGGWTLTESLAIGEPERT